MNTVEMALAAYLVCLTIVATVLMRERVHPVRMAVYAWCLEVAALAAVAVLLGPVVLLLEVSAWLLR